MTVTLPLEKPNYVDLRDRERTTFYSIPSGAATKLFSSDVQTGVQRRIVYIYIVGDGVGSRTVTIAYGGSGTGARTANIFSALPVAPTEKVPIPQGGYDLRSPIINLVGGENLSVSQNSGSGVGITVIYWDDKNFSTGG